MNKLFLIIYKKYFRIINLVYLIEVIDTPKNSFHV